MLRVNSFTIAGLDISLNRMTGGREVGRWTLYVCVTALNRSVWFSREPRNRHDKLPRTAPAPVGMGWFVGRRSG